MRERSHSANTENIVNHDVDKVDILQQEFNEPKQILYTVTHVLQNSANNKNVEKYNSFISENLTTTTGVQNKKGHKTNNKRKERRKQLVTPVTDTNDANRLRTFRKTYAPKRYNGFRKLWDSDRNKINLFIGQANNFHPTIKFTAEISENETSCYYHSSTRVLPVVPREQCR